MYRINFQIWSYGGWNIKEMTNETPNSYDMLSRIENTSVNRYKVQLWRENIKYSVPRCLYRT